MSLTTLKKNWQFRTCYQRGRKTVCDYVVVFHYNVPDAAAPVNIGVVASKRVGNAVHRNRAKRLLRIAAQSVVDKFNDPGLWVVLVAKSAINGRTSRDVVDDLQRGLCAAKLIPEADID